MYGLEPADVDRITATALAALPGGRERYVSVVARDGEPLAAVARAVEREVFESAFGNDADVMAAEYGPYEHRSLFFVVLDTRLRRPAGVARVIQGDGARRLKTLDDAPAHIGVDADAIVAAHRLDDRGVCWDFATAAVRPEYRAAARPWRSARCCTGPSYVPGRRPGPSTWW